jgi:hypothetical protein
MPITDPWGITYSPRDMLFEGSRRTMGIFHWPMGVAFEGPGRTMGVLHWPMGVAFKGPRRTMGIFHCVTIAPITFLIMCFTFIIPSRSLHQFHIHHAHSRAQHLLSCSFLTI